MYIECALHITGGLLFVFDHDYCALLICITRTNDCFGCIKLVIHFLYITLVLWFDNIPNETLNTLFFARILKSVRSLQHCSRKRMKHSKKT